MTKKSESISKANEIEKIAGLIANGRLTHFSDKEVAGVIAWYYHDKYHIIPKSDKNILIVNKTDSPEKHVEQFDYNGKKMLIVRPKLKWRERSEP